jgi:hypothetical protein
METGADSRQPHSKDPTSRADGASIDTENLFELHVVARGSKEMQDSLCASAS